jgi:hypothetical protein
MSRPPKRQPRAKPDQPITTAIIRDLLVQHVLTGRQEMPGESELNTLACNLEHWRKLLHQDARAARLERDEQRIRTAYHELSDALASLRRTAAAIFNLSDEPGYKQQWQSTVDAINEQQQWARRWELWYRSSKKRSPRWEPIGPILAEDLQNALLPANPRVRLRLSNRGPVARFVAKVVPLLTGDHPTTGSVATQLKTERSTGKTAPG